MNIHLLYFITNVKFILLLNLELNCRLNKYAFITCSGGALY